MAVEDADRLWRVLTSDGSNRPECCFAIGTRPFVWSESASGFIRLKINEDDRFAIVEMLAESGAYFERFDVQRLIAFAESRGWEPRADVATAVHEIAPYFGVSTDGNVPAE